MESERDLARSLVFDLITMLANPNKQIAYQAEVPIADVPAELVCTWFDDNDFGPTSVFAPFFEHSEWQVIRTFDDFYKARLISLPKTSDLHELQSSDAWKDIVAHARSACIALRIGCT